MKYQTIRFGEIDVTPDKIITLPEGILGFPNCTKFTLLQDKKIAPFQVFQSLDFASLSFIVVNPQIIRPDYHFDITQSSLARINTDSLENLIVLVILTMSKNISNITANLQGPLIINTKDRLAFQSVLVDTEYTTKEPIMLSPEQGIEQQEEQDNNQSTGS